MDQSTDFGDTWAHAVRASYAALDRLRSFQDAHLLIIGIYAGYPADDERKKRALRLAGEGIEKAQKDVDDWKIWFQNNTPLTSPTRKVYNHPMDKSKLDLLDELHTELLQDDAVARFTSLFNQGLKLLGWSVHEASERFEAGESNIKRWLSGDVVPPTAPTLLRWLKNNVAQAMRTEHF